MFVGRDKGNDTSSPSPSRTSECVSGPSITEGSNPQDRMELEPDHSRPFVDLFTLGRNTVTVNIQHVNISPIPEEMAWKVDSLVHNWDGLYAYAYPPTRLIMACLNKVRTENVEIILIHGLHASGRIWNTWEFDSCTKNLEYLGIYLNPWENPGILTGQYIFP